MKYKIFLIILNHQIFLIIFSNNIESNNIETDISNNITAQIIETPRSSYDIENPPIVNKENIKLKMIDKALEMVNIPNINQTIKKDKNKFDSY